MINSSRAIKKTLAIRYVRSKKAAKKVVNDWIAVEKAIVGSVVRVLLPQILEAYLGDLPSIVSLQAPASKVPLHR